LGEYGPELPAEFFNLFNHAQFGLPVNDIRHLALVK